MKTIEESLIDYMYKVKKDAETIAELMEALERASDAITNDDLSQSERNYEAQLARAAITKAKE